jgi:putative transposase
MIDRAHALGMSGQCALLALSRSSLYYRPTPVPAAQLALMAHIDRIHLAYPFYGSRRMRDELRRGGITVGRDHVRTLMQRMGIEAIYRKPRLSDPMPGHKIYPYLLRELAIEHANQVWCADITYLPMARGFAYLVAVMDWATRKVLAWRLSNTMQVDFCLDALEEALVKYRGPQIFNSDQGSQFTSEAFTAKLSEHGIQISMDGRGRWVDNVFIERLWRSVKYEEVYLHGYGSMSQARAGLGAYFAFYNQRRGHQSLQGRTPDEAYHASLALARAA